MPTRGWLHTVRSTEDYVNDVVEGNSLLQGQEEFAFCNAGYRDVDKRPDAKALVR